MPIHDLEVKILAKGKSNLVANHGKQIFLEFVQGHWFDLLMVALKVIVKPLMFDVPRVVLMDQNMDVMTDRQYKLMADRGFLMLCSAAGGMMDHATRVMCNYTTQAANILTPAHLFSVGLGEFQTAIQTAIIATTTNQSRPRAQSRIKFSWPPSILSILCRRFFAGYLP